MHTGAPEQCKCSDVGEPVCEVPGQVLKLEWGLPAARLRSAAMYGT